MIKIRLSRQGAKNQPKYRIVVAEKKFKRDGRFLEIVGHYDTTTNPSKVTIDKKQLEHWLSVGAQPTETVKRLIKQT
jgi:small subunit ribosomal protein S16